MSVLNDIKNTLLVWPGVAEQFYYRARHLRLFWHNWGPDCGDNFSRDWSQVCLERLTEADPILSQYKIGWNKLLTAPLILNY